MGSERWMMWWEGCSTFEISFNSILYIPSQLQITETMLLFFNCMLTIIYILSWTIKWDYLVDKIHNCIDNINGNKKVVLIIIILRDVYYSPIQILY